MRYTLLQLVQSILRSMESDEISDINETQEAKDVVDIIKECYFDIVGDLNMAEQEGLFKLDSSGDITKPVLMYIPSNASKVQWLKYNISDNINIPNLFDLTYMSNKDFLYYQRDINTTDISISQMTIPINGINFVFSYRKDSYPKYYTIFDESSVVFDSYKSTIETTLTSIRTVGWGDLVPAFTISNTWVPDLDPRQFQLLLNDAKNTAFIELKQTQNALANAKYRRNKILTQKNKNDNDPTWSNQNHAQFGRKGSLKTSIQKAMRVGQ